MLVSMASISAMPSKLEAGLGRRSSDITRDCRTDLASFTPHPSRLNEDAAERKG